MLFTSINISQIAEI